MTLLTRQDLYELVWSKPAQEVAADLDISGPRLKQICARFDVPKPPRGYWAQKAAGWVLKRPPLPPRKPGMSHIAIDRRKGRSDSSAGLEAVLVEPEPAPPVFEDALADVEARVRKALRRRLIARPLSDPHRGVVAVLAADERRRESGTSWDRPKFEGALERRRLRILNTLFSALDDQGAKASVGGAAARWISVKIEGEWLGFELDHPRARPNQWNEVQVHGGDDDTLRLSIPSLEGAGVAQWLWEDTEDRRLERDLPEVLAMLFVAAEAQYRRKVIEDYEHRVRYRAFARKELERRREEAIRLDRERRAELEKARRDKLLKLAGDHRAASEIRAFLSSVKARLGEIESVDLWLIWAHGIADRLDPLTDLRFLADDAIDQR